jgi:hypothetical protein
MRRLSVHMKKVLGVLFLLCLHTICFAQIANPCDGTDNDDGCPVPLDTWVLALVAIAFIYGIYRLHKKQKALSA